MPLGLIGIKIGMTQVYDTNGQVEPVTVLQLGPCPILQVRTLELDGYHAVQIGFKDKPRSKATRAERGHVSSELTSKRRVKMAASGTAVTKKADCEPQRYVREFRLEAAPTVAVGEKLDVNGIFASVKMVDVIGTSKGRGYSGVMKRHGFSGMPAAHGAKKVHREAGSTGSMASQRGSGRPKKGLSRAGQYGNTRVTARGLTLVSLDLENNLMLVRGCVPGPNGGMVMVRPTNVKR